MPVDFVKLANTLAYAFFGTGSDALEPNVTVPARAPASERAPARIARRCAGAVEHGGARGGAGGEQARRGSEAGEPSAGSGLGRGVVGHRIPPRSRNRSAFEHNRTRSDRIGSRRHVESGRAGRNLFMRQSTCQARYLRTCREVCSESGIVRICRVSVRSLAMLARGAADADRRGGPPPRLGPGERAHGAARRLRDDRPARPRRPRPVRAASRRCTAARRRAMRLSADEPGFEAKSHRQLLEKEAIARAAAELVEPGQAIALSGGHDDLAAGPPPPPDAEPHRGHELAPGRRRAPRREPART